MTEPALSHPSDLLPWYVNGSLEGDELRAVEQHLRSCLVCRREVEELRELRGEMQRAAPKPPPGGLERLMDELEVGRGRSGRKRGGSHPTGFRHGRPLVAAVMAAMVVAAVGLGLWRPWSPPTPPPGQRTGDETEVLRSRVDPEVALPRQAFILSWEVQPPWRDARFSVVVTTEDLTPVAEAHGLEETSYRVPTEALAKLPAGVRLFWRVEAVRPDGARRNEVFQVRVE